MNTFEEPKTLDEVCDYIVKYAALRWGMTPSLINRMLSEEERRRSTFRQSEHRQRSAT